MVTDRESKFTIRESRAMAVGVDLKIVSNGTTGTFGKIWLRIVKLRLPSLNYVKIVAKIDILMRIKGYIIYLYSLKRLANNIKIYIIYNYHDIMFLKLLIYMHTDTHTVCCSVILLLFESSFSGHLHYNFVK